MSSAAARPISGGYDPLLPEGGGRLDLGRRRCLWCLAVTGGVLAALAGIFYYKCHIQREPWWSNAANGAGFAQKYFGGRRTLNYWDLPAEMPEEQWEECIGLLHNVTTSAGALWGFARAAEAAQIAYKCTKVPGVFEKVPEKLRGVFWMKGNPFPEVLAVLQLGQYFEDERVHVAPFSPFMWSWPHGLPDDAPFFGLGYQSGVADMLPYSMSLQLRPAFSLKFEECPAGHRIPVPFFSFPGHACERGSGGPPEMTYAVLQLHTQGCVEQHREKELYTVEEDVGSAQPGSSWHRGIYGAPPVMGRCACFSLGSYELVKIIDAVGRPLEPHYSEFLAYMGGVPLRFWAGFADEEAKNLTEANHFGAAWARTMHLWCQEEGAPDICSKRSLDEEALRQAMEIAVS